MRKALLIAAMLTLGSFPASYAISPAPKLILTQEVKVGARTFIKLPGNPQAGFKWRLNPKMSQGLDLVSVKMVGWLLAQGGGSIFEQKKSLMNVSVAGKAPGEAKIAFDYYRIQEGRYATITYLVKLVVKS